MKISVLYKKIKLNKFFKDSVWSLLGNVFGRGFGLLAGIIIARFLGKDIYGEYGIIKNTILTIGMFSTFGLGYTATKYVAELKKEQSSRVNLFIYYANQITLVFSGFMALLLIVFAGSIADSWLNLPRLATPLRILAAIVVFNALTTLQIGVLAGFGKFKEISKINIQIGVLTFLLSAVLTYFFALNGAIVALLIVQVINWLLNYIVVKRNTNREFKEFQKDKDFQKEIIKFSTPIALQEAVYSTTSWLSSVLLIQYSTYGELGMYTAATQWNAIILFIPGILRNVILSHLSENTADDKAHSEILRNTIFINVISTLIPFIIVSIISPFIASFYGVTFVGLAGLISLSVLRAIPTSISNVYAQAYTSLGRNWEMLGFRLVRDIMSLVLFVVFVKNLNMNGASAMVVSSLVLGVVFLFLMMGYYSYLRKKIKHISI